MIRNFLLALVILWFIGIANAADFSVGVSPGMVDAGDFEPGEQKIAKFSIFTVSNEPLLVYFDVENGNMDFFNAGRKESMPLFSEEPAVTWVQLVSNPVEIDVTGDRSGGRSWKDISLVITVPENAEPGYHAVGITPRPTVFGQPNAPIGTAIVSVSKIYVLMRVKGDAKRDGLILDTTAAGYSGKDFKLRTFFQNTGTTTVYASATNTIYRNGSMIGEYGSPYGRVKPQSVFVFEAPVNEHFAEGEYNVSTTVNFVTGQALKDATIDLYKAEAVVQEQAEFPWLIIILIIVAVIIVISLRWLREKRV